MYRRRTFHGWSFTDLAVEYGLELCFLDDGSCDRQVSKKRHHLGHADRHGRIHWERKAFRKANVRRFLTLVAWVVLKQHRSDKPLWQKIFECDRWAYQEAERRFHMHWPRSYSDSDRRRALRNIWYLENILKKPQKVRTNNERAYKWMRNFASRTYRPHHHLPYYMKQ